MVFSLVKRPSDNQKADYLVIEYEDTTEYAFPSKNLKVVCNDDGCRVIDVNGAFGYQYEITGFSTAAEAIEYALNYN